MKGVKFIALQFLMSHEGKLYKQYDNYTKHLTIKKFTLPNASGHYQSFFETITCNLLIKT